MRVQSLRAYSLSEACKEAHAGDVWAVALPVCGSNWLPGEWKDSSPALMSRFAPWATFGNLESEGGSAPPPPPRKREQGPC